MPARTLYPSQSPTQNWSASSWSLADDNARDQAKPISGDSGVFTALSTPNIALDEDSATLAALTLTGYAGTLAFAASADIITSAAVALTFPSGMSVTASAGASIQSLGNFTTNIVLPSNLTVNEGGTATVVANVSGNAAQYIINASGLTVTASGAQQWGSFLLTVGTYAIGSVAHTIVGNITRDAGTASNNGAWTQTGTGNLYWGTIGAGTYPTSLTANGTGTIPTGANFNTKALAGSGSIAAAGTGYLFIYLPTDNFWTFTGTATTPVQVNTTTSGLSTGGAITLEGKNFSIERASGANPLLLDGNLNLKGAASTAGNFLCPGTELTAYGVIKFDASSYSITANNITMGNATNAVTVDLGSGYHTISGTISRGAGTPALNLGQSQIALMLGTLNGSNTTITADAAITNRMASVVGGTVSNVVYEAGKTLDSSGGYTKDGGGNTTGEFWFGSSAERWHPAAIRERSWGFMAGTRR